ncbi:MAG: hypothetical protein GY926_03035 [bacterium]|nr:hypothetical protein [bacterium]
MSHIIDQLTRRQLHVARPSSFTMERPDTELRRLTKAGSLLQLSKGFYALVPEAQRGEATPWRPTLEGAALGMAAALYGPDNTALAGPSAARAHNCYPRALGEAYVTVPRNLRPRKTVVGTVRFITRDITTMDTTRIETDLGPGWATSFEQTALDLSRNRPAWNITDTTRSEMLYNLAQRIDWDLIDEIAEATRSVRTLTRLRSTLNRAPK